MVKYFRKRTNTKKTTNTPVTKAITKYKRFNNKKPTIQKVANNRNAIMTLSRQVKELQLSKLGMFQKRAEQFNWIKSTDGPFYPYNTQKPLAFCLNQFNGRDSVTGNNVRAPVYFTNASGNGEIFKRFQAWNPGSLVSYGKALNPHWSSLDDKVSPEIYKPLGTSVKIEMEWSAYPAATPTNWYRIDIVRPRKTIPVSAYHELQMPTGLGQFSSLTENYMLNRNFINPTYWEKVLTKWVPISNNSGVAKNISKVITINRSYKNTKPIATDFNSIPVGEPGHDYQPGFAQNTDPRDLEWMVISSGFQVPERISILRQISWRDQDGTTA